jgi:riboflavin kinase/FMN adenylyltransferase
MNGKNDFAGIELKILVLEDSPHDLELIMEQLTDAGYILDLTHVENEARISSTLIRDCLISGKLETANNLLGYPYFVTGEVVLGNRLGNTIGFPTANIECAACFKQIPADGVYAVTADWKGVTFQGMLNIGIRPTIDDNTHKTFEVHLFDMSENLYGQTLRVNFVARLRDEKKFGGLDELKTQLALDMQASKAEIEKFKKSI